MRRPHLLVVRLLGAWVLFGAAMKLFFGSPLDLPRLILDLGLGAGLTFRAVVATEILVGGLALLRPAAGRWPVALLLVVFLVVILQMIAEGATSCGCLGKLTIPPTLMLAIDAGLLLLFVLAGCWRPAAGTRGFPWATAAGLLVLAVALPVFLDREAKSAEEAGAKAGGLKPWVELKATSWVGKPLEATELAGWLPEESRIRDGVLVLWRASCEVCAEHLERLAITDRGERDLLLVQLPETDPEAEVKVHVRPQGSWVHEILLPETVTWFVVPPVHVEIADGKVQSTKEGMDVVR